LSRGSGIGGIGLRVHLVVFSDNEQHPDKEQDRRDTMTNTGSTTERDPLARMERQVM